MAATDTAVTTARENSMEAKNSRWTLRPGSRARSRRSVGLARLEEQQGQPRRPGQKAAAQNVGEVLLQPQIKEVANVPQNFLGQQQDQAEGDQPGEGVPEAGRAAPRRGDHGVDEVPGDVDEQGGLEAQQELDCDQAERRQSPVGPDVAPGPEQVGGYAAGARAAVPELEISPRHGRILVT